MTAASPASTNRLPPAAPLGPDLDLHRGYITRRFEETLTQHIGDPPQPCTLTDAEWREVIDTCNTAVAPLGRTIPDQRWRVYTGVTLAAQSSRHLTDRQGLKAVCALSNTTFVWEDMDSALHNFDAFLPELHAICDRYYPAADSPQAYEAARVFITSDHMYRDSPIMRTLCTTSLEQYFRFRVTDVGADCWMRWSYPIYRDREFTEHCKSGLAARMVTRGLTVVNDAYSFRREQSWGQLNNCFYLCPLDGDGLGAFFDTLLDGIAEDIACIKSFDPITRDVLLDLIYGNFIWTRDSARYRQPHNDVNSRIR
ncbi:hypothetical protein [Nocardia thraciensis]